MRGSSRQHTATRATRANNTWTAANTAASSSSSDIGKGSKHKTLVLSNASKDKSVSPAAAASTPLPSNTSDKTEETAILAPYAESSTAIQDVKVDVETAPAALSSDGPNSQDKSTAQEEDVDMEDGEIDESTLPPPELKKPPISLIKQGNEIIINGVTFVSDATGRKLVRKDSSSNIDAEGKGKAKAMLDDSDTTSTPSKTSIDGQAYVRTKSGNLISTAVLKKRQEMAAKKKRISELVAVAKNVQKARQA